MGAHQRVAAGHLDVRPAGQARVGERSVDRADGSHPGAVADRRGRAGRRAPRRLRGAAAGIRGTRSRPRNRASWNIASGTGRRVPLPFRPSGARPERERGDHAVARSSHRHSRPAGRGGCVASIRAAIRDRVSSESAVTRHHPSRTARSSTSTTRSSRSRDSRARKSSEKTTVELGLWTAEDRATFISAAEIDRNNRTM